MKRISQVIRIREEHLEDYKKLHRNPWPGVNAMLKQCHIQNYSIYYWNGLLFSYFEYTGQDYESDMARMAADETTQKWWSHCDPCQEPVEDHKENEWWHTIEEVYHLD